jgi:hypothetical protein
MSIANLQKEEENVRSLKKGLPVGSMLHEEIYIYIIRFFYVHGRTGILVTFIF